MVFGCTLIVLSLLSIIQIHKNSKNTFAYILMAFTFGYGVIFFTFAFDQVQKGFYLDTTNSYCYIMLSIQVWLFALKYFEGATQLTLEKTVFTQRRVRIIKWSGIIIYSCLLSACYVLILILHEDYQMKKWSWNTPNATIYILKISWAIINIVSSFITIYALVKLFHFFKQVDNDASQYSVNRPTLIAHFSFMVFQNLYVLYIVVCSIC